MWKSSEGRLLSEAGAIRHRKTLFNFRAIAPSSCQVCALELLVIEGNEQKLCRRRRVARRIAMTRRQRTAFHSGIGEHGLRKIKALAGLEYHGVAGSSLDCQQAVLRLLQCQVAITGARIITSSNKHCLLLTTDIGDEVAIKSGFSSGYGGAGPVSFSVVLQLLYAHGVEIDEWIADDALIGRLDQSALTTSDVEQIRTARAIRPSRWSDYILERHHEQAHDGTLWCEFSPVIPFSIIDRRLLDLTLKFWSDPDSNLLKGYRRLEDIVRARTGLTESNTKLFSRAFGGKDALLTWPVLDENERSGRLNLLTGAYMAYRNPRAHQEKPRSELLAEFLLLNQLFRLEAEAAEASKPATADPSIESIATILPQATD